VTDETRTDHAALPVKASACTECGLWLERCPFGVQVVEETHKVVEVFGM
jgi:Fe-S-cluster-containing hydrogenase component 2